MKEQRLIGGLQTFVPIVVILSLVTLVVLVCNRPAKVSVSFVNTEPSHGIFPSYAESERLAFAVRNAGSQPVSVEVSGLEDEKGTWIPWMPSLHGLGDAAARQTTHFYLYFPQGSHPRSIRIRLNEEATTFQKTKVATRLLLDKVLGHYTGQIWFARLKVPTYEFVLKMGQPVPRDGNETSAVAHRGK